MCDCAMNYITCVPEDRFEVVLYCDASSATVSFWQRFQLLTQTMSLLLVLTPEVVFASLS